MDAISSIVLMILAAVPVAVLAGWFAGPRHSGLGALVDRGDADSWWRTTMPWPQGVQEEDGVRWRIPERDPEVVESSDGGPDGPEARADDFEVALVRTRSRVGLRPPADRPSTS
jgi:hypothetical protein